MKWSLVTERDYDPNPKIDPLSKPLPFILTPRERDVAKVASLELERNRRRRNQQELAWALRNAARQPDPPEAA